MTPEEFVNVVLDSMEELNYFKRNERAHPEDIVISLVVQAEAVAKGAGFIIQKVAESRQQK
jgi:hypothetical protein